jgi:hypothetical protein
MREGYRGLGPFAQRKPRHNAKDTAKPQPWHLAQVVHLPGEHYAKHGVLLGLFRPAVS